MNPKAFYVAALMLLLCPVRELWAQAQEDDEARQLLERMIEAAQHLNYEGTFVYVQGQRLETMRIIHGNDGSGGERQRMFSLNGTLREVVVRDNTVICISPKHQVVLSGSGYNRSPFPVSLPQELSKLEQNYRFATLGDDRIAGLATRVIAIQPRDKLRFGYRLWLDRKTGMVLRTALLDEDGHIVEQLMFTDLQVKPEIDPSLVTPKPPSDLGAPVQPGGEPVGRSHWGIAELPQGFAVVMHNRFTEPSDKNPTEHMVFSDGLATVSVFLEKLDGAEPLLRGATRMGAMNAFGTVTADYQVVAVGEAPQATIEMIANSLHYDREERPE